MGLFFLMVIAATSATEAQSEAQSDAQSLQGLWTTVDVGCRNANYVYPPDEKAFMDAVRKHEINDTYEFRADGTGEYIQYYVDQLGASKVECTGRSTMTYKYDSAKLTMTLGPMSWSSKSNSENASIECSGGDGDFTFSVDTELTSTQLKMLYVGHSDTDTCGGYFFTFQHPDR